MGRGSGVEARIRPLGFGGIEAEGGREGVVEFRHFLRNFSKTTAKVLIGMSGKLT